MVSFAYNGATVAAAWATIGDDLRWERMGKNKREGKEEGGPPASNFPPPNTKTHSLNHGP